MRVIFAALFFLMCSGQTIFAQKFSLSELILLVDKNLDDFDTYVNAKNYKYDGIKTETWVKIFKYSYNRNIYNSSKAEYWISKKEITGNDIYNDWVSWQTIDQKDYLAIKTQLKEKGFTLYKTGTFESSIYSYFRKGKIQVKIYSGTNINESGGKVNYYEINVIRLR